MTPSDDNLSRRLSGLVDSATPPIAPPYGGVLDRHARRGRRRRVALAAGSVAAVVAVVGTIAGLAERDPGPSGRVGTDDTSSPEPTGVDRPEPTYEFSNQPSPVVLRLADRDVELEPWTYCWSGPAGDDGVSAGMCSDGFARTSELEEIGSPLNVEFWFGVEDWTFEATFQELGTDCPRHNTVTASPTGPHTFEIAPAGPAGRYRVDLFGRGRGGDVAASFVWTTPSDGPVEQPVSYLALVTDDDTGYTSYGVELGVSDLAFQPREASAVVTVASASGATATFEPRLESGGGDCYAEGSLFFSDRDMHAVAREIAQLGEGPFDYRVVLTIDGQEYVGTAVWPRDEKKDEAPNTVLTFEPPLPAYTGD